MIFEFGFFSLSFFVAGILTFVMAGVSWRRRAVPGALPFAIMQMAISVWILTRALAFCALDFSDIVFWTKMMFFGSLSTGVMWLAFALEYTGSYWWRQPRNLVMLCLMPMATFIIIWTNQWHGFFWTSIEAAPDGFPFSIIWKQGFWFWVIGVYQYAMIISGILILWIFTLRNHNISRKQMVALMFSLTMLLVSNGLHLSNFHPVFGVDLKPLIFTLSALIQSVVIFYFGFLEIIPAARGTLVENMPVGVLVLNNRGCVIDMNPASEQILGLEKKKTQGKKLEEVYPKLEKVYQQKDDTRRTEIITEEPVSPRHLDVQISTLKNRQGIVAGHLLVLRDITERKLTRQKLEALYDQERYLHSTLQAEMEKRMKYSRAIVHELKTPLTAILSSSELLIDKDSDSITNALARNIRSAALKLEHRTNDLIELAKGEVGILTIYPFPVNVSQLIRQSINAVEPEASAKGISVVTELPQKLPYVLGDEDRLKQVLSKLLANALKYTHSGKVIVRTGYYDRESLIIQVEDNGPGISKEQMEHLFDPYKRKINEGQQFGGLGIGLALCKILVELHKGRIWVDSIPGKGSSFNFTIPIVKEAI